TQWARIADVGAESVFGRHDRPGEPPTKDVNGPNGLVRTRFARGGADIKNANRVKSKRGPGGTSVQSLSTGEGDIDVGTGGTVGGEKGGEDPDSPEAQSFDEPNTASDSEGGTPVDLATQ